MPITLIFLLLIINCVVKRCISIAIIAGFGKKLAGCQTRFRQHFAAVYLIAYYLFCSALGISDFTVSTLFYRKMNLLNDKLLPGTLNTQCVIPVAVMALAFISVIQVDSLTLSVCIIAQMIGAHFGPRFVLRFSIKSIRLMIGTGLLLDFGQIIKNALSINQLCFSIKTINLLIII